MDISTSIPDSLTGKSLCVSLAESSEVEAGLWSDVVKELKDNVVLQSRVGVEVHVHVASAWRLVDGLLGAVGGELLVNDLAGLISVSEGLQGPLHQGVDATDVLDTVQDHKRRTLMLIEVSLELVLDSLEVVIPLRLEELKNGRLDLTLRLELLDAHETLVVFKV